MISNWLERTGTICCSPSLPFSESARIRTPSRLICLGTGIIQLTVAMLSGCNSNGRCDLLKQIIGWSVAGSNSSMRTRPDTASLELLMTCVLMLTSSPWRTKRGRFGRTIKGLLLMTSFVSRPYFRSLVLANICSFQVVLLSGRVKFTNTSPSSFVCKVG